MDGWMDGWMNGVDFCFVVKAGPQRVKRYIYISEAMEGIFILSYIGCRRTVVFPKYCRRLSWQIANRYTKTRDRSCSWDVYIFCHSISHFCGQTNQYCTQCVEIARGGGAIVIFNNFCLYGTVDD